MAIGWTFYRMGSVPNFSNEWKLFFKDYINIYIYECLYAHFIIFLLCCVIYFSLLTWHFRSCLNPISILSASDLCECCIVLYRNPFCPMAIRCPSDVNYFWCERAIRGSHVIYSQLHLRDVTRSTTGWIRLIRTRLIQIWHLIPIF